MSAIKVSIAKIERNMNGKKGASNWTTKSV